MSQEHIVGIDQAAALNIVTTCADIIFEHAPVMLIAMNEEGVIVKVNQRWLATMDYELDEVLGHKSVEFKTEESGSQAVADSLPLFWQSGRAHSIGLEMVRKDGRVLDFLLDAYVMEKPPGERIGIASLYERGRASERHLALTVVRSILELTRAENILYGLVPSTADELVNQLHEVQPASSGGRRSPEAEGWDQLSHIAQEVSSDLHAMAEEEELRLHSLTNQRQQVLLMAETEENALAKLTINAR